jgi:hypothetical protein
MRDTKLQNTTSTVQFNLTHNSKECVGGLRVQYLSTCGGTRLTSAVKENMKTNKLRRPSTGIPIRTLLQRLAPAHRDNHKRKG